ADRVRPEVLVHLGEELLDLRGAPGTRRSGLRVDDDGLSHETRARERHETEERAGRIAAGTGDEARVPDPRAMELRQSVDRLAEELRRRVRAVPARIHGGIVEPEIGGDVDHAPPAPQELADDRRRRTMRERREDDLRG